MTLDGQTPEIAYPCHWEYRLVGRDADVMQTRAAAIMGDREHTLKRGHQSKKGTFISLHLKALVFSHDDRRALFDALRADSAFLHVL